MYLIYFQWLPVETTLSIFNVGFLFKNNFFKELIETKEIAINAET